MKNCYVVMWRTEGFTDFSVFSSLAKANDVFDKIKKRFNLEESEHTWYVREAYGKGHANTKSGDGSLYMIKKTINFNSII